MTNKYKIQKYIYTYIHIHTIFKIIKTVCIWKKSERKQIEMIVSMLGGWEKK